MTHFGRQPACVWPDQKLGEVLKIFLKNRSHMAIVRDVNNIGPVSFKPHYIYMYCTLYMY